jgi:hypothetical protein
VKRVLTPGVRKYSIEEHQCEDFFEKTTVRDIDGKYIVRLTFRNDIIKLGQSILYINGYSTLFVQ